MASDWGRVACLEPWMVFYQILKIYKFTNLGFTLQTPGLPWDPTFSSVLEAQGTYTRMYGHRYRFCFPLIVFSSENM